MEDRTPDLRIANATLYQLSYDPFRAFAMLKPNHDMTGKRGNSGDGGMICRVPMTGPSM